MKLVWFGILNSVLFGFVFSQLGISQQASLPMLPKSTPLVIRSNQIDEQITRELKIRKVLPGTQFIPKVSSGLILNAVQPQSVNQLRGLWVDAFGPGFKTSTQADQLVRDAKTMGINVIFLQVGRRGDCYCNKALMPRSADLALSANFDPLEYVIAKAHAVNIQVHAWIITTAVWNTKFPFGVKNHVFNMHSNRASGRNNWLTEKYSGERQAGVDYMLDPGHPDAAEWIANAYLSVVQNYAVDGIQFDRVRYPDSGDANYQAVWGYNPFALERFLWTTNRIDRPVPNDLQWSQWRRDQITNLVRRVSLEAKMIKPDLWISAATITYKQAPTNLNAFFKTRTYSEVLQDWPSWTSEGIIDLNIPMNYKRAMKPDEAASFIGWNQFAALTRANAQIAIGTALYLNPLEDNIVQIKRSLAQSGISGWIGYSYRTPDVDVFGAKRNSAEGFKLLTSRILAKDAPFSQPAIWGTAPINNLHGVFGRVTRAGLGVPEMKLELRNAAGQMLELMTDANGYYGIHNAPLGEIVVHAQGDTSHAVTLVIVPGHVTRAINLELL